MSAQAPAVVRRARRRPLLPLYTALVILYLQVPIIVMILFGFNDTGGRFNFKWQGFTLEWYRNLFEIPDLTTAIKNSIAIALVAALVATVFGTMIALAMARYRFRGQGGIDLVLFMNIATPEIVLGAALLGLFLTVGLSRGFMTILIAHIMFCIPFVAITVRARAVTLDRSLEEAAQDLGASPWVAFWKVTFPALFPGILAGALLAFALSIDDYIITSFVAGQTLTFPVWVVGASRVGVPPQVNVMGTLIFLFGIALVMFNVLAARRTAARNVAL